ncbi:transglycosylase SLT domain-containing protein [Streptomyces sp. E11-3]|uniref:aggregation-promoting factor C-terminal-like domain-containing protein n=1 Tax=Streptomyces sp. E11-3 TaxID=3110112 RepID=UPI00397FC598
MLEGNRVSRISVRGFAVASATAVTTVGAVVGVASGNTDTSNDLEATAATGEATLLAEIPAGQQAEVQTASLTQQADAQAAAADSAATKSAEESARKKAAKDAVAKKEAAEKKAAEEKAAKEKAEREAKERAEAEAKEKASRSESRSASASANDFAPQSSYSIAEVKSMARQMVPGDQFQCFSNIVDHESGWNYKATNPSSGAYGLMQALPAGKMSSAGADWQTNPATQIKWGLGYMNDRYGSPCGAWSFWQNNNWY